MRRALLALTILSLAACGSSVKKLCKDQADCDPDYDVDTCMSDFEEQEEAAADLGCEDSFDDFVKCAGKEGGECVDGYVEITGCDGEALAYFACAFDGYEFTFSTTDTGY